MRTHSKKLNGSDEFTSGTLMLFQQTAAPTGWTKQTAHNDKALRIVSGSVSSGGATAFATVFGSGKNTGAHTLTESEIPAHNHSTSPATPKVGGTTYNWAGASSVSSVTNVSNLSISNAGGGSAHQHTLSLDLQYVDTIIAAKD